MIESAVTDLPLPDSPTSPSVSPAPIVEADVVDDAAPVTAPAGRRPIVRSATSRSGSANRYRLRVGRDVLAEHAPHRVGDLADGGVRFDGRDDRRHEVGPAARRAFDGGERRRATPTRSRLGANGRARAPL